MPPVVDLLGEEVPLNKLVDIEEENLPANGDEVDIQLDQLVGPGEEGFPILNNGGMQLPPNPMENDLLNLADEMQQEHIMEHEEEVHAEIGINLADNDGQQGEAAPDNPQHDDGQAAQGFHLQVGMALVNNLEGDPAFMDWERAKTAEATRLWSFYFCNKTLGNLSV